MEIAVGEHSLHPQQILSQSSICAAMDAGGWLPIRHTVLINGVTVQPVIVANQRFTCRKWLMTPYGRPQTEAEIYFNSALNSALTSAQTAFKRITQRWRCLREQLQLSGSRSAVILSSCVAIHNVLAEPALLHHEPGEAVEIEGMGTSAIFNAREGRMVRRALAEHIGAIRHRQAMVNNGA